ncbi:MAG: beta-ketoacyl-ACP synthase [Burkholderiaceae bacterium]
MLHPATPPRAATRIAAFTATSCVGAGNAALFDALASGRSGLAPCRFDDVTLPTWIGQVPGVDDERLAPALAAYDCRNNRLAQLGLRQDGFEAAIERLASRYGTRRIGVFVGTSTSGMLQLELAYRRRDADTGALPADFQYATTHNTASLARFIRLRHGLRGPAFVISTACSSGAKAHASAQRAIDAGLIDAALVGAVDSLCLTTLYGFASLELLAETPCKPWDQHRSGLSLGEAAAFVLLERSGEIEADSPYLTGCGESSDAHHMSSPCPDGAGAEAAMRQALAAAGLQPADIDYLNLHGTATPSNDRAEDAAAAAVFAGQVPVSSTKGTHGHALGAAGALEAVVALLCLREGLMPGGRNVETPDPALSSPYLLHSRRQPLQRVMSNSFGFGGSNCSLIFERGAAIAARATEQRA